ncbi:hypothetical protein D1872_302850 [compost metagenome]
MLNALAAIANASVELDASAAADSAAFRAISAASTRCIAISLASFQEIKAGRIASAAAE